MSVTDTNLFLALCRKLMGAALLKVDHAKRQRKVTGIPVSGLCIVVVPGVTVPVPVPKNRKKKLPVYLVFELIVKRD
jgi:hypothetical protein